MWAQPLGSNGFELDTGVWLKVFPSQAEIARSVRAANLQLVMLNYLMMPDTGPNAELCNMPRGNPKLTWRPNYENAKSAHIEEPPLRKCV